MVLPDLPLDQAADMQSVQGSVGNLYAKREEKSCMNYQ
jgi:hypothetical protein